MFNRQKNYQTTLIIQQVDSYATSIEQKGLNFQNDLNEVAYNYIAIQNPQKSDGDLQKYIEKIKLFYVKNQSIINTVYITDTASNILSLYIDPSGKFIIDFYQTKLTAPLSSKEQFSIDNNEYLYLVPVFYNNKLIANIVANLNIKQFFSAQIQPLSIGNNIFQSISTPYGIITTPLVEAKFPDNLFTTIDKSLKENKAQSLVSNILINNKNNKYLTVCYPFKFLDEKFIFLYHFRIDYIIKSVFMGNIILILFNLIFVLIIIFYYLKMVKNMNLEEEKLRESEEAFKEIIEFMPIGIIITTKDNHILNINKTALRTLQIDNTEEIIGKSINHKFLTTKALAFDNEIASVFETDHFIQYENNGNEIVLYKKDIPLRLQGQEIVVQSFIDVTPIEKSRKREIAANMAKSEFLAKMSHEIRTPMNGIIGMADALLGQNLTQEQTDFVNIIKKSADMLLNILNDILDLSKIEAGKMVMEDITFELRKEIGMIATLFKVPAEEKNLKLNINIEDNVPDKLIGDPFRIRQILNNLINNAIKFTQKGKIEVSVKKLEEYNRNIVLQFKIADTGIGIPEKMLPNIFQSFTQADNSTTRKYGGTGLGTTIAKQLVELMNGEITVESPSGISDDPKYPGTCFTFTIELFSNEKNEKNIELQKIISFDQIKTLIIGNNIEELKPINESFSLFNVNAECHIFNKSTIDMLKKNANSDSFDERFKLLVIFDSATFDAFKLLSRMQEAHITNSFYILIISSNDKPGNYLRTLRIGADHYIVQPYETSQIFNFLTYTFSHINLEEEISKFKVQQLRPDLNILVAEDNPINQKVAFTLFKNIGYAVDFAKTGIEVLDMIEKKQYDIIFMDIMMPEMDGIQATIEIRKKGIRVPIIAMTANISKEERKEALDTGMDDYVTKPVRMDTVKKILIKLFSQEIDS
jgi:PAS domain S-box-containing protein